MAGEKVLVVDDEKPLIKVLKYNLDKAGYSVMMAANGHSGLEMFRRGKPDMVILDLMLPKIDGIEVCKAIRRESSTPVLILTARKDELDRVLGLEAGADDYVTKPFSVREVLARVKTILRRTMDKGPSYLLQAGGLEVDLERYEAKVDGQPVALSYKEFELLKCLFRAGGRVLDREQLLETVWGYDKSLEVDTTTVDQHIFRLRAKLGPEASRIVTVKNVGYRLKTDG